MRAHVKKILAGLHASIENERLPRPTPTANAAPIASTAASAATCSREDDPMFMPTAEEKKRLLRGTIPRARKLGVDDTLRGWSWSSPPLLSPYEVPLGLSEVANAYCTTGRDVYARRVLDVTPEPNEKMLLGGALHNTFRDWTVHAKKILYACGAGRTEEAMQEIQDFPPPDLPEARVLVSYETDAIEFRLRETLGQFPRIKTDALVAQVLPVTLGAMLDGAFLSPVASPPTSSTSASPASSTSSSTTKRETFTP